MVVVDAVVAAVVVVVVIATGKSVCYLKQSIVE